MSHAKYAILALLFLAAPLQADVSKEDIRKLAAAGISDDVILTFIRANGPVARMSSDDLVQLRGAGASDRVLAALVALAPVDVAPPAEAPVQDTTPAPVLPQTTLADYTSTDVTSPYATYYSGLPYDYFAPAYSYYYSPWFGACSPVWGCGVSPFGFGCGLGLGWGCGFGFPCFNSCFSPWWGGCFGCFGIGCPSFGCCFHPFGFCGRPFGSFFPRNSFGFGFRGGPVFRSSFAASASVVANHQQALMVRRQAASFNGAAGTRSGLTIGRASARGFETRAAAPSASNLGSMNRGYQLPRSNMVRSYNYSRSYNYVPRSSYSGWNSWRPQSFSGGNSWRPAPAPHSSGSSWGHGGGGGSFGGGGGWGGGGGHGGHGGHRR